MENNPGSCQDLSTAFYVCCSPCFSILFFSPMHTSCQISKSTFYQTLLIHKKVQLVNHMTIDGSDLVWLRSLHTVYGFQLSGSFWSTYDRYGRKLTLSTEPITSTVFIYDILHTAIILPYPKWVTVPNHYLVGLCTWNWRPWIGLTIDFFFVSLINEFPVEWTSKSSLSEGRFGNLTAFSYQHVASTCISPYTLPSSLTLAFSVIFFFHLRSKQNKTMMTAPANAAPPVSTILQSTKPIFLKLSNSNLP